MTYETLIRGNHNLFDGDGSCFQEWPPRNRLRRNSRRRTLRRFPGRIAPYLPFGVGESLEYSVSWGKVFKAGAAKVMTKELVDYQGHDVFKISVVGKSRRGSCHFL